MFSTCQRSCIVGDVGPCEIVGLKSRRYLLPSGDTLSRIGLSKSPEMARRPVHWVGGHRARREITHCFGTASGEPIRVRQSDQRLCVVGLFGSGALEIP